MTNAPGCRTTQPGDPIRIGDTLGHRIEPNLITGRVMGFIRAEDGPTRVIFRRYRDQVEKWPSGDICSTALPYRHRHFADGGCERFIPEDVGM